MVSLQHKHLVIKTQAGQNLTSELCLWWASYFVYSLYLEDTDIDARIVWPMIQNILPIAVTCSHVPEKALQDTMDKNNWITSTAAKKLWWWDQVIAD